MESKALVINKKAVGIVQTSGFSEVFSSFGLVNKYKLWGWFLIPFFINLIVLSAIWYFSYTLIMPRIENLIPDSGWWFDLLRSVLKPLLFIVLGVLVVLLYSIIGSIVCAPFNDILSERVEVKAFGENFDEKFSFGGLISDIARITVNILKLLGLLLLANITLLLLNLIPAVGTVAYTVLSFVNTLFFFGLQFFQFPMDRRRFSFGEQLKISRSFLPQVIGVGLAFFVLSLIPIVGFLSLNMASVGAAVVFNKTMKPALSRSEA